MPRHALFLLLSTLVSCAAGVQLIHLSPDPSLQPYMVDCDGVQGVPLERYLWQRGLYPVTGVCAGQQYIDWKAAAFRSLWYIPVLLRPGGGLSVFGDRAEGADIAVFTAPRPDRSVLDVAPTACEALGLGGRFDGSSLVRANASQVVVIYVDGAGWYRYLEAGPAMANLTALRPAVAIAVYPSISNVNAAAMLTGARPERNGIDRWENRTMPTDNAIDRALRQGVSAAWIDGRCPPVRPGRGIVSVGDANGDGSADDEITDRAIVEHTNGVRLLYVHLAGPDRALHESGPRSRQSRGAMARADALIGRLVGRLRPGTLVIAVADHGGHEIAGGRGSHGSLLPEDMLIPLAATVC